MLQSMRSFAAKSTPVPAAPADLLLSPLPVTTSPLGSPLGSTDDVDNRAVATALGIPVCEALFAYKQGEFARAVDLLLPLRKHMQALGGSDVQRYIFDDTLLSAAMLAGETELALAMTRERTTNSPQRVRNWWLHAEALDGSGRAVDASAARQRAVDLGLSM
eukprot:PLAT1668.1.p1 GENE.PLAT1668.1~~PLAT1668.1.p1  ORF type:complete len:169 (-),score=35.12 PLAT1668.1:40-525(-)